MWRAIEKSLKQHDLLVGSQCVLLPLNFTLLEVCAYTSRYYDSHLRGFMLFLDCFNVSKSSHLVRKYSFWRIQESSLIVAKLAEGKPGAPRSSLALPYLVSSSLCHFPSSRTFAVQNVRFQQSQMDSNCTSPNGNGSLSCIEALGS
jgi:hypothetical protein